MASNWFTSERQPASRHRQLTYDQALAIRAQWDAGLRAIGMGPEDYDGKRDGLFIAEWLREAGHPCKADLAAMYGVNATVIHGIIHRTTYLREQSPYGTTITPEQRRAYYRAWRLMHRDRLNASLRERRRRTRETGTLSLRRGALDTG